MRRKGTCNDGGCSMCCRLKERLDALWQRAAGCIVKIRGITPDGQGNFDLQAGQNVNISEISNGIKISTTGGVSYYQAGDNYIDVDNNDLKISLVDPGQSGGVALHDDLEIVAQSVTNIIDGITTVGKSVDATNQRYQTVNLELNDNIPGITLEPVDNNSSACRVLYNYNEIVFQVALNIYGTMTGTSNWFNLFKNLPSFGGTVYYPYLIYAQQTDGSVRNLLSGINVYLNNGNTINTSLRYTFVAPIIH